MDFRSAFGKKIEGLIVANLREEYPYMKIDAVHDAANASIEVMRHKIREQRVSSLFSDAVAMLTL